MKANEATRRSATLARQSRRLASFDTGQVRADGSSAVTSPATVLKRRIELFTSLPMDKLDQMALHERVKAIGKQ